MRNAVLAAMAEVLVQVLNGDQLEEAARGTRDQFLTILQAHVCDINGLVRSRVLQIFTRIVQCKVSLCWGNGVAIPSAVVFSKGVSVSLPFVCRD